MEKHCESCCCNPAGYATVTGSGWVSHHGDSRDVLRDLPENSIDMLLTDPPYGTGGHTVIRRMKGTAKKYRTEDAPPLPGFDGDALHPDDWRALISSVLGSAYKCLKPGASVILFCDWLSYQSFREILNRCGFSVESLIIWDKGRSSRPVKNNFRRQHEFIIFARKPGPLIVPETTVYLDGVIQFTALTGGKLHITQKPLPLMKCLLQIAPSNAVVLDPFQGSGTTGIAALETGRQYIGVESTAHYHQTACNRMAESEMAIAI